MAGQLVTQVQVEADKYVRKGGKRSRKDRRAVMLAFAAHAEGLGARQMTQVGATHVVRYWKAHRGLKDATLANHWYAICDLWELFGKPSQPPKPWKESERGDGGNAPMDNQQR